MRLVEEILAFSEKVTLELNIYASFSVVDKTTQIKLNRYHYPMEKTYYNPKDLKKFGNISEWNEELGTKFFDYYNSVFAEGKLTAREKSLIALAVAHTIQCPYCIDAYTSDGLQRGIEKGEMMEALHVAGAIRGGASLVHGVQMMNKVEKLSM